MPATWPTSLPQAFQQNGYSQGEGEGRLRTQPDQGPGKVRRRFTAVPKPLTGVMEVTNAQLATLDSFVLNDIQGGSLPFTFPDPLGGSALLVMFGQAMPSWTNLGGGWFSVTLDLLVMP